MLGCYVSYNTGVTLTRLGAAQRRWEFKENDITTDGQNTIAYPEAYNEVELSGGFLKELPKQEADAPPGINFRVKQPVVEEIVEEDADCEAPPPGSSVLRSLDSCFDISPPKSKIRKKVRTVDGTPESEETWI